MAYLVDSDWTIDYLNRVPQAVALLERLGPEGTFISILTYIEVYQGVVRDPDPIDAAQALRDFLTSSPMIDLTVPVAERCARLRQHFLVLGQRPARRAFDLVIAATALEHDLTLVTRNIRDYADIPALKLYQPSQA